MDSEKPPSFRNLLTRIACTLLGVLLLYVLGIGPAVYVAAKFPSSFPLVNKVYGEFSRSVMASQLKEPMIAYLSWWVKFAGVSPSYPPPQSTADPY